MPAEVKVKRQKATVEVSNHKSFSVRPFSFVKGNSKSLVRYFGPKVDIKIAPTGAQSIIEKIAVIYDNPSVLA